MFTVAFILTSFVATVAMSANVTGTACDRSVRRCQYGNRNGTSNYGTEILRTEPVGHILSPSNSSFSSILRYVPRNGTVRGPIRVDADFLSTVELLYNNDEQLRVLLTLLRSDQAQSWVKYLRGYGVCATHSIILTCVSGHCVEHDLNELPYTNSIFAEDVLGFQLSSQPFGLRVVLAARNRKTKADRALSLRTDSIGLFDAIYNVVIWFFVTRGMHDAPLIQELCAFNRDISRPHREQAPSIIRVASRAPGTL